MICVVFYLKLEPNALVNRFCVNKNLAKRIYLKLLCFFVYLAVIKPRLTLSFYRSLAHEIEAILW